MASGGNGTASAREVCGRHYQLGRLDIFGQRINITIEIPRKNGIGTVTFTSGWMVEAGGKIKLNTPYGGK